MGVIPIELITRLQLEASKTPNELCGVIASDYSVHPVANVSKNPTHSFVFSKCEYFELIKHLEQEGLKILLIYHSHPKGNTTPSTADLTFINYSNYPALIITKDAYRIIPCPESPPIQ